MRRPILTLTTDFGASDHYVGAMKGVILSICPRAQIVDICHDVTPFQIAEGAYVIAQAYDCFPKKTVHVVVVDPGVGTARRPILVEAAGQYFVGPDNGVLAMVYSSGKHKVRLIASDRYFRQPVSATFHGRDVFAPVAAHVAAGVPPSRMGKPIEDYLRPEFAKPQRSGERTWSGAILKIDRFGNMVTNFHVRDFPGLLAGESARPTKRQMTIGRRKIGALAQNYAESRPGALFLIVGSSGYLEVSVNQGSAAKQTGCKAGEPVKLTLG
jgi:S-adenosyl-L-methionine hydrolase (adenosine-forming)